MYRRYFFRLLSTIAVMCLVLFFVFYHQFSLLSVIFIAFLLGLRHGFDIDHIIAIDNVTRQLVEKKRAGPNIGLFFALGHSSIVFLLTLSIVLGMRFIQSEPSGLLATGAFIGTLVSAVFLWITGVLNTVTLVKLKSKHQDLRTNSVLSLALKPLFKLIDRPYKMYPIGFLFGLGFDTATEIALLGLAATGMLSGQSIWLILALPISFAMGMALVDSVDAALMVKLFENQRNACGIYRQVNMAVLGLIISLSFIVGSIECASLFSNVPVRRLSDFISDYAPWIGVTITAIFVFLVGLPALSRIRNRNFITTKDSV